jgi:hypothetical protein
MTEFTCPKCGNFFHGIACRPCVPNVKGYVCSKCGERIRNPFWAGNIHQWLRTDWINVWNQDGAFEVEAVGAV